MIRRPPISTRTDTLFPYTTLFRSQIFGRFGSDFIGLSLGDDGEVVRLIAGEAKWRNRLTQSAVDTLMLGDYEDGEDEDGERVRNGRGVWFEINRDMPVPHGLRQLQRLLELRAPENYAAATIGRAHV